MGPTKHQLTDDGQDYSLFSIHCGDCGQLLYEFVHKQVFVGYLPPEPPKFIDLNAPIDRRTPSGYAQAQSWCSAKLLIRCTRLTDETTIHTLDTPMPSKSLNQVVRSRAMTRTQFNEWIKANDTAI